MRSAAGLNHFSPYENFPFQRPCRIKYRALRLVRHRYLEYSSTAYRRLSSAMTAVVLVAAIRLAPFSGGGLALALVQVLFPRPSRSRSDWKAGSEIGFVPLSRCRLWRGIEASWGQVVRERHNAALFAMLAVVSLLPGCATAPLVQGAGLSSYDGLKQSDGKLTKSRLQVRKEQVAAAKTVSLSLIHI